MSAPATTTLDFSKPVQTRDGRKVTILSTTARGDQPIVGQVEDDENVEVWSVDGTYWRGSMEGNYDLLNVPEKRTVWLAFTQYGDSLSATPIKNKEDAVSSNWFGKLVAAVPVTFTVGEGLE